MLNRTQGFRIFGANAGDQNGWSVSNAGDVNGDKIMESWSVLLVVLR